MPGRVGTTRRKDGNHDEVLDHLRKSMPVEVWPSSHVGNGFPDAVVCFRGHVLFLEIKRPGEKLTEKEAKFAARFPVLVVHSGEEAALAVAEAAR